VDNCSSPRKPSGRPPVKEQPARRQSQAGGTKRNAKGRALRAAAFHTGAHVHVVGVAVERLTVATALTVGAIIVGVAELVAGAVGVARRDAIGASARAHARRSTAGALGTGLGPRTGSRRSEGRRAGGGAGRSTPDGVPAAGVAPG